MKGLVVASLLLLCPLVARADQVVLKDRTVLTGDILSEDAKGVTIYATRGTFSATVVIERERIARIERAAVATTQAATQPTTRAAIAATTAPAVNLRTPEPMSVSVERFKVMRQQAAAVEAARRAARDAYIQQTAPKIAALQTRVDEAEADWKAAASTAGTLAAEYKGEQDRASRDYDAAQGQAVFNNGIRDTKAAERATRSYNETKAEIDARFQPQVAALSNRISNDKAVIETAKKQIDAIKAGLPRR